MRLFKANVLHVAYVDRPCAGDATFSLVKSEDGASHFRVYVPFSKVDSDGLVEGKAYNSPGKPDKAGDIAYRADLEHMAESFKNNGSVLNYQHQRDLKPSEAKVLTSKILADGSWHLSTRVFDKALLEAIRAKKVTGFSVGGSIQQTKRVEDLEREELVELATLAKHFIEQLDDQPPAKVEEALRVGRALLEDASSPQEVVEALAYLEKLVAVLEEEGKL